MGGRDSYLMIRQMHADQHFQQAYTLHRQGKLQAAEALYRELLRAQPQHANALHMLGIIEAHRQNHAAAVELFSRALALKNDDPILALNLGSALLESNRHDDATRCYAHAIALRPDYARAHAGLAHALQAMARYPDALRSYESAIALQPGLADALKGKADVLAELGRNDEALQAYDIVITAGINDPKVYINRGTVLLALGREDDALAAFDAAISAAPGDATAHYNRAHALDRLQRPEEAVASLDLAITLQPNFAAAWRNLGNQLAKLHRDTQALDSYDRALILDPHAAQALSNRGIVLARLGRYSEALEAFEAALALRPDFVDALQNLGNTLNRLKQFGKAAAAYARVLELEPDKPFVMGQWLHARMKICAWAGLDEARKAVQEQIEQARPAAHPFAFLSMAASPALHRRCSEVAYRLDHGHATAVPIPQRAATTKIKVGYFSSDFHEHATAYLMAGMFAQHDRSAFEVFAFSYGSPPDDAMHRRLRGMFDRFVDVGAMSDREVMDLARALEIDIAVDLKGYTQHARPAIFALRAAPVQISYLGYPGTLAMPAMDYAIVDHVVVPLADRVHYSEKLIHLPDCYQVNDNGRPIAQGTVRRADHGLPEEGFVFCCFNNSYKITPQMFDIWMRLLLMVPGSVLWLYEENAEVAANLALEAGARGVDAARLVFARHAPVETHLARHTAADLFLDTELYNAHTTASDALWTGLPVVTCPGTTFPARVAASMLQAVGLAELVCESLAAYEAMALALARDPRSLAAVRHKLAAHRRTQPLFDTARITRQIEHAYKIAYSRWQGGLAPDHIDIEA